MISALAGLAVATAQTGPVRPVAAAESASTVLVHTLAQVSEGSGALTTQVTLPEGAGERVLLVRAVGPGLAGFGVETPVTQPGVAIFEADGTRVTPSADRQVSADKVAEAARAAGTFPLPIEGRDEALLVALGPGRYTVQVTSAGGAAGTALLEVYDVTAARILSAPEPGASLPDARGPFTRGEIDARQLVVHLPFLAGLETMGSGASGVQIRGVQVRAAAAWFDGRTSEIVIPKVALDRRAFAIAMWIKLEDGFPGIGLVNQPGSKRRSQHLHLVLRDSTPRMGFYLNDLSTGKTVKPQDGWSHLVFQYTGSAQEIWLNGTRIGTRAARPYLGAASDLHIGKAHRWSNVPAHDFKGGMRDFRLYTRALTAAEVAELARK